MSAVGAVLKKAGLYPLARRAQVRTRDLRDGIRARGAMRRYDRRRADFGLNEEERDLSLVASFTTHPKRLGSVAHVADAMLRQTVKPDRVLMVLAPGEWESAEARSLLDRFEEDHANLLRRGLEIVWGEDVRSHNKYLYAFRNCPGSFVVTVDDDKLYPCSLLEGLLATHRQHPGAVICGNARALVLDGPSLSPDHLMRDVKGPMPPSMSLMAIGWHGVLYPPGVMAPCLDGLTDIDAITSIAPTDDDMWLKCHEVKHGIPTAVMAPGKWSDIRQIPGTWGSGLCQLNYYQGRYERTAIDCVRHFNLTQQDLGGSALSGASGA